MISQIHCSCSDGNNFESECRFNCAIGFALSGSKTRVCQDDRKWSGVGVTCEGKR